MSSAHHPDPLTLALTEKARTGAPGFAAEMTVAAGDGWRVDDIVCTSGPHDTPYQERQVATSISLVLGGTFVYRSDRGATLMSAGTFLLGNPGAPFECSHEYGEGDRCLSFKFDAALIDRVAHDAGACDATFSDDRLPPLRPLAPLVARARAALDGAGSFEEVAVALAGAVCAATNHRSRTSPAPDPARIARVLSVLEADLTATHSLADLARIADLSRYHFLRTLAAVTGVTPHQWLLRARLRDAARRLTTTRTPVTDIALDVGFDDLSNFIRTFRAEFGRSPTQYRRGS